MNREDITPGLQIYLGAYSAAPPSDHSQKQKSQKKYLISPACNWMYLQAKLKLLDSLEDSDEQQLVKSFQSTIKYTSIFNKEKAYYKGIIEKRNQELASGTYSSLEGTSGGPLLHYNGQEVLIVGVNNCSAGVGEFSIQKIRDICQQGLMIPRNLKFNFSFIQKHIEAYFNMMQKFFKREGIDQNAIWNQMDGTL